MADLQPVRRVMTGHDRDGRAVLRSDDRFGTRLIPGGDAAFDLLWTTETVPAGNNAETDGSLRDAELTLDR